MSKKFTHIIGLLMLLTASSSYAVVALPMVAIDEIFNSSTDKGAYSVTNNSGYELFAFAVGSNSANSAWVDGRSWWAGDNLTESEWNGGLSFWSLDVNTSQFPYSDYFSGYSSANLYFNFDGQHIQNGETTGYQFFYSATYPASSFVAFYYDSNDVVQTITGQASVVPVPGAAILFASGVLGWLRIRKA